MRPEYGRENQINNEVDGLVLRGFDKIASSYTVSTTFPLVVKN